MTHTLIENERGRSESVSRNSAKRRSTHFFASQFTRLFDGEDAYVPRTFSLCECSPIVWLSLRELFGLELRVISSSGGLPWNRNISTCARSFSGIVAGFSGTGLPNVRVMLQDAMCMSSQTVGKVRLLSHHLTMV